MSTNLTVTGTVYAFPTAGQSPGWGAVVTNWATAVTNGMLQKSGGSFTLTADVDFGATYGLKSAYYSSRNASPASAGQVRLGNTEVVSWRNAADSADLDLSVNGSNVLTFNGNPITTLAVGSAYEILQVNSGGTAAEWSSTMDNVTIGGTTAAAATFTTVTANTSITTGGDIDVSGAGAWALGASVGANNLTLGGATSTVVVAGALTVTGNLQVDGTTTTVNSTTLEVDDANIEVNKDGNAAAANTAVSGLTVTMTDATDCKIGYNTAATSKFICGVSGSEAEIATVSHTQTFTNKTLTSPTLTTPLITTGGSIDVTGAGTLAIGASMGANALTLGSATGSVVIAGTDAIQVPAGTTAQRPSGTAGEIRYNSDSGSFEGYGSAWGALGGGSSGINYITDYDAESGVGSWATYDDVAGTTPVDGTGTASAINITWTSQSGTVLRGSKSFLYTKDAADRQGEGASFDFTTDAADDSKQLTISFDFDCSDTDYSAGDLTVYIYDVTNTTLITPATTDIPAGTGTFKTTFVATTSNSYRLILHQATTNASALTCYFDNFKVGPEENVEGVPVTEWATYTPSNTQGFGTITSDNLEWSRIGSSLFIRGYFTTGTVAASEAQIELPDSVTIGGVTGDTVTAGRAERDTSSTSTTGVVLATGGDTFVNFGRIYNGAAVPVDPQNGSAMFSNTERVTVNIGPIPISEWSGSTASLANTRVEYAYNSDLTDASDTTSFAYGPSGGQFGLFTTAARAKRVRFQNPIQPTDRIFLEITENGGTTWTEVDYSEIIQTWSRQNTSDYGVSLRRVTSSDTDVDVTFYPSRLSTGATFGASGANYSSIDNDSTYKWRVVKCSNPLSVGQQHVPQEMSDQQATLLGHKEYRHGTSYAGGNAPTITLGSGGGTLSSVDGSSFMPYQTQDGTWRLKFNFAVTLSSTTRTGARMDVAGVTPAAYDQHVQGGPSSSSLTRMVAYATASNGRFWGYHTSGTTTVYLYSGDIELASKPTWAY